MVRAVLADVLTGSRLVMGVVIVVALTGDRLLLFAIILSIAWATDVFDGRLARAANRPTLFGDSDMLVDTWVGACVLVGFGASDRLPIWLVAGLIVGLGALYLRSRNPAVSQVLQAVGYGGALWVIFQSEEASVAIPLGTLAVLMLLEYKKFFGKVLPMFFEGVAAIAKRERYEGRQSDVPTEDRTGV
jgi:phosphatidylglycerophosphate synthase